MIIKSKKLSFEQVFSLRKHTPLLMGIANITPDSFSDGGDVFNKDSFLSYLEEIKNCDVAVLDIGAESTRPNAQEISSEEEINRLKDMLPLINENFHGFISIDTYKAKTAEFAFSHGVEIVNDVYGFLYDKDMARVVSDNRALAILMHQDKESKNAENIVTNVIDGLSKSLDIALKHNIPSENIMLDVGIGFYKTYEQNLILLKNLSLIKKRLPFKFLLGASRKSFIGHYLSIENPKNRVYGTLAVHLHAMKYDIDMIRVHDIKAFDDVFKMINLIENMPDYGEF